MTNDSHWHKHFHRVRHPHAFGRTDLVEHSHPHGHGGTAHNGTGATVHRPHKHTPAQEADLK